LPSDRAALAAQALAREVLQRAGVVDALEAGLGRRAGEVFRELLDLALEVREGAEGLHVEHGQEAAVVVAARGVVAEAEAGQDAGEDLDHRGEAVALVAL